MIPTNPTFDTDAHRLLRAGRLREALAPAERAVEAARVCLAGHGLLATILLQLGRMHDAEQTVAHALELEPGSAEAYDGLAYVSMLLDRHDRANELYRRAVGLAPDIPRYWYNLACSERSLGGLVAAEAACDRCLVLDPTQYPTYLLRSELRVQTGAANHIGELESRLARCGGDGRAQAYLGYALAKELDDVERFEEAFVWFARSAQVRRSQFRYDVADDERRLRRLADIFSAARVARSVHAEDGERCIFVVGLPRSGTTLVERILSGLRGVRSNGETENFSRALNASAPGASAPGASAPGAVVPNAIAAGAGDMFERAAAADPRAVAERYARLARLGEAGRVIEKLPTNYLYLGAIHRALPRAALLWVSRSPLDSCFALFRTLFGNAYPYSYEFEELARYYAAYVRLLQHWRSVCGAALHEIVYEDLVREPGVVGERIARHCGLTWDDRALDIAKNQSVALTASAAQVRRPIYGTSSGRWRHYRANLAPLIRALRRHGIVCPDDA